MRQTTDNGWADWLVRMMETLRASHNPSCLLPLKRQSHHCQATASIRGSNHRLEEMCALIVRPTKMMSLQRGSVKTGNSGIKGSKSQGLLQRSWVQGIHFLCFLLLLKQPYSAFFWVARWMESQTLKLIQVKHGLRSTNIKSIALAQVLLCLALNYPEVSCLLYSTREHRALSSGGLWGKCQRLLWKLYS